MSARGCSRRLQRTVTDFGADVPYAKAMDKLVEHYGIVLAESTIRRVTQHHAQVVHQRGQGKPIGLPKPVAAEQTFIVEMDGTMVPTVQSDPMQADKRKGKTVQWQEAKVSLAHVQGSKELICAATLLGGVETAGKQLRACAKRAGFGKGHRVHGVGDGAPWIATQIKERFGGQGSYLVDFYHVCDYLSAAALAIHAQTAVREQWLRTQKERLKTQGLGSLLNELQANLEPSDTVDELAPVRRCYRYLSLRQNQLGLRQCDPQRLAHWVGRNRKRPSLPRAKAPETTRLVVETRKCRTYAGPARKQTQRRMAKLLGHQLPLRRLTHYTSL